MGGDAFPKMIRLVNQYFSVNLTRVRTSRKIYN